MRPHQKRPDVATCYCTGHVRVRCVCGALVYECRCGVPAAIKRMWFDLHPTAITMVYTCRVCKPPKKTDRRGRERRTHTTESSRLFDARQKTRRKR